PPTPTLFPYTTLFRSPNRNPSLLHVRLELPSEPEVALVLLDDRSCRLGLPPQHSLETPEKRTADHRQRFGLHGEVEQRSEREDRSEEHTSELQSRFDL